MIDRRLLISLLALPACGPSVGVGDGDDPREPDGGEPEKIGSSCNAAYTAIYACYEELGYGSSGGGYESSGSYEPGAYIEDACNQAGADAASYGPACTGAFEEVFACIASLDCNAIAEWQDDSFDFAPAACEAVFRDASQRCPEGFPQCGTRGFSSGPRCEESASSCLDGNSYAFRCSEPGATQSCECERNGEVLQTVTLPGDLACGTQELYDELTDACGFPPGVFSEG